MPQIIVTADGSTDPRDGAVLLSERVNLSDFDSGHYTRQLVERLGWAVADADALEHATGLTRRADPQSRSRADDEYSSGRPARSGGRSEHAAQQLEGAAL